MASNQPKEDFFVQAKRVFAQIMEMTRHKFSPIVEMERLKLLSITSVMRFLGKPVQTN